MKKFFEVLNDTIDYFLLGDVGLLQEYKIENKLSNDLATEFTTNKSGDDIVKNGILIPMSKIVNQPYTIVFNSPNYKSEFDKKGNNLIFKKSGYILKVENEKVILFTWWFLNDFSDKKAKELLENPKKWNKPYFKIKNGWYDIEILGGFTNQESTYRDGNGVLINSTNLEPTLEFNFIKRDSKGNFSAKSNDSFELIK